MDDLFDAAALIPNLDGIPVDDDAEPDDADTDHGGNPEPVP